MRKLLLVTCFAVIASLCQVRAGNAELFDFNENAVLTELASLSTLENYIELNEGVTFSHLVQTNNNLLSELNLSHLAASGPMGMAFGFEDIEWGSFAWGFCCWPIGIFTVLLNDDKDSNHKISFFIGIGTAFLLSGPFYLFRGGAYYY